MCNKCEQQICCCNMYSKKFNDHSLLCNNEIINKNPCQNPHIQPYKENSNQLFYKWHKNLQTDKSKSYECWNIEWKNASTKCDRNYLCNSETLKIELAKINADCLRREPQVKENAEEKKYRNKSLNGSFHKLLQHSEDTGTLTNPSDYLEFVCALLANDQITMNNIPLASGAEFKFVDPLASLSGVLIGADPCSKCINLAEHPALSSKAIVAEMIELYGMQLARDVWFGDYATHSIIADAISYLQPAKSYLPDLMPVNVINTSNIFRGNTVGELVGPYISQLFLLNIPKGALTVEQKYEAPPAITTAQSGGFTVEWGRNNTEMVNIQNGNLSILPSGAPANALVKHYINNARVLAEVVHSDPAFQIGYSASLILLGLGASSNPGIPVLPNQTNFCTNGGAPSLQCALATVTEFALRHAWYWKWQIYRRLRPEVVSLWVDNIKNSRISNASNYDIDSLLLNNPVLSDIKTANGSWGMQFLNSYTLSQCYKEGSPAHPAYPSGHATIAGACATIIKMFLDCEKKWTSLPGVSTPNRKIIPSTVTNGVAISNPGGTSLINYPGSDIPSIYIYGEVNKLASNVAIGRNWAGVHYRTDATQGIKLGEDIAIRYMADVMSTWVANKTDGSTPSIQFRKFDGTLYTVKPNIC